MKTAVQHLQYTHEAICDSIERTRERIAYMEESLQKERLMLSERIEEANAIQKAIDVLSDDDSLPTRLEGSD